MSELYDILVETPPTKVILLALDQGLWDCERSLAELSALCEANHMEAVAQVTQKRQTPETGIVLGSGKLEEAAAAAADNMNILLILYFSNFFKTWRMCCPPCGGRRDG